MSFVIFEILEPSVQFQKSICSGVFSPVVGCSYYGSIVLKGNSVTCAILDISKVSGAAISKHLHEILCDGVHSNSGVISKHIEILIFF